MATAPELAAQIEDDVAIALLIDDEDDRTRALLAIFREAFAQAADEAGLQDATARGAQYALAIQPSLALTDPDNTDEQVVRIASIIATAAVNGSVAATAGPDDELRWVTMEDERVRELHVPMHGESVQAGMPFDVGGFPLYYPGQPVGPPEVWINCRCHLEVNAMTASTETVHACGADCGCTADPEVLATNDLSEATFEGDLTAASDKPWGQFSAGDYTPQQWRRACLVDTGEGPPDSKSRYKFPVREPGGALNRNGVHAAAAAVAGARGGTNISADQKAALKRKLRGLYSQLGEEPPDSLKADGGEEELVAAGDDDSLLAWPPSTSPPGTHDAPGWLTHPRETERLRRYWVRGPGAAKIAWGTPNDLTRCHNQLVKYVGPYAWATCQNMHKEALGYWNPESRPGALADGTPDPYAEAVTAAFTAADSLEEDKMLMLYPTEWFQNPAFTEPTPLNIQADGRVRGHLATWDTCHVGIEGKCVLPPRSKTNYAHFHTGEVETREGDTVSVGQITMDTGHADRTDGPLAAVSHYDNTGTGVADVVAGEDDIGIWVAGAMRPGVSELQMYTLKATGALSGDWRRIGGNLELVAALAVNVPGFPIPKPARLVASGGIELSLVAAAIVEVDPNIELADAVAHLVVERLAANDLHAKRLAALRATVRQERIEALTAAGVR